MADYLFGFLMGFLFMLIIEKNNDASMKSECQKNLPRSQQCILVAVPEVANDMPNMQER